MAHREELSRFLKSARGRLAPALVGLPVGERRRSPGLRREEVASLAGMSVTWYTWFEQGRDVQLSAALLERLSTTLRLTAEEREFLFALAQHRPPPLRDPAEATVHPGVQHMLDALDVPALVMLEDWQVVGWNRMVAAVFRDYATLPPAERNLFRILLLSDRYRGDMADYAEMVGRITARFKWDYSRATDTARFDALIAELSAQSPLFRDRWALPEIVAHLDAPNTVDLPGIGPLAFRHTSYAIERTPSQRLVIFAPADAESAARVRAIAAGVRGGGGAWPSNGGGEGGASG